MVTATIFKNGSIQILEWVEESKCWVYQETRETVGDFDVMKINIGNMICGAKCARKKVSDDPDSARKYSIFVQRLEEALMWLRSIDHKEHHAIIKAN